jgi:uncharacterized phiE125 gp8 family phage protein
MAFLRVDNEEEIPLIASLIQVAREYVEMHTSRALITQTWKVTMDRWPRCSRLIELPRVPVIAVDAVKYFNDANVETTIDAADYFLNDNGADAMSYIERGSDVDWPSVYDRSGAVSITFTAGYGPTGASVPEGLKHAMKLIVSNFYDQRAPVNVGNIVSEMPMNLRDLVASFRAGGFIA